MKRALTNAWRGFRNLIVGDLPLITGIVMAAVGTASGDPKLFVGAVLTGLLRFVVSPAIEKAEYVPKPVKQLEPEVAAAIQQEIDRRFPPAPPTP